MVENVWSKEKIFLVNAFLVWEERIVVIVQKSVEKRNVPWELNSTVNVMPIKCLTTEKKICEDADSCLLKQLNGECQGKNELCNNGNCTCIDGYKYTVNICKASCHCNEENGEKCEYLSNGEAYCVCKEGYFAVNDKCVKADECFNINPKCSQNCDKGKCTCFDGYKQKSESNQHECVPDDPNPKENCDLKCEPGICIFEGENKKCVCPDATHVSLENNCTDRCKAKQLNNVCPTEKCESKGKNGFECICEGKYKRSANNSITCDNKLMCSEGYKTNECSKQNAKCVDDIKKEEGYYCKCEDGFTKSSNYCIPTCETEDSKKQSLDKSAICVLNEKFEPIYKCPPLFEKDTEGNCKEKARYSYTANFILPKKNYGGNHKRYTRRSKRSVDAVDYVKVYKDFDNSFKKVYGADYGDFIVLGCKTEGNDFLCGVEIKFKTEKIMNKKDEIADSSKCVPLGKEYCVIESGISMKIPSKALFETTDPCEESIKNINCGLETDCERFNSNSNEFKCTCIKGYDSVKIINPFPNDKSQIHLCKDIDECLGPNLCTKNSSCSNIPGDYECKCKSGFMSTTHDIKKDGCVGVCEHKLCLNGQCVQKGDNEFSCICDDYHSGMFCNVTNTALENLKKSGVVRTAIVGGVLGAILLFVLIAGFIYYRRNQKDVDEDEEFIKHRERAIQAEKERKAFRHRETDVERRQTRHSPERRQSGDYRNYRSSESHIIPRAQVAQNTGIPLPGMRDASRFNDEEEGRSVRAQTRRYEEDESRYQRRRDPESSHRSLTRSSESAPREERRISTVQYKNRGYEDD